jgi:hypothetical protein
MHFCWLCLRHYTRVHFRWWNLFGCPIQSRSKHYLNWGKLFAIILLIILIAVAIPACLVAAVLIGIIGGIVYPLQLSSEMINKKLKVQRKVSRILLWITFILLSIALYPISALIFFGPGSCILIRRYIKRTIF